MVIGAASTDAMSTLSGLSARGPASGRSPSEQTPVEAVQQELENRPAGAERGGRAAGEIGDTELTDAEKREIEKLKETDRKVRAHERAHKATAGGHATGGVSYVYKRGPDGQRYAVGGEVKLDVSEVPGDPEATIRKMRQVKRAALAPVDPSPQDMRVAAIAAQEEAEAQLEAIEKRREETAGDDGGAHFISKVTVAEVYFGSYDSFPASKNVDLTI